MEFHRKICNKVKSSLINSVVNNNNNGLLVDLCSGRGGDIFKWDKAGIKRVVAFDNHKESVIEAISRYKKSKVKTKISFNLKDVADVDLCKELGQKVSLISCQFALHYFCLETLLYKVSESLVSGGFFFGVVPDGDIIDNCLKHNKFVNNVCLERIDANSYYIDLVDDSQNNKTKDYFEFKGKSSENMIRKQDLIDIGSKFGLELVKIENLKHNWGGNHISELYFSFKFIKIL